MECLGCTGTIASIIGALVSIGAIIYAWRIHTNLNEMKKNQKENAQGPYKIDSSKSIYEIQEYFKDINRILIKYNSENYDEYLNDNENLNHELISYYKFNKEKMNQTIDDLRRQLGLWIDLKKDIRLEFENIIKNARWLKDDFFKADIDQDIQIRIWTTNYLSLMDKKDQIDIIINKNQGILDT